jgi:hypothetical protein
MHYCNWSIFIYHTYSCKLSLTHPKIAANPSPSYFEDFCNGLDEVDYARRCIIRSHLNRYKTTFLYVVSQEIVLVGQKGSFDNFVDFGVSADYTL